MGVLDGKAAIVTGSARGIGRATAELLAEQGARVLINDLDADVAEQAASEISGETAVFGGDLTKEGVPDELIQKAVDEFGQIDIIVNNAGYTRDDVIHKMTDDEFQAMLDIHTVVPFRILRAAAPHLREPAKKEKEEGREVFRKVVNISSISGTMGNAGQVNYSAGKAARRGPHEDAREGVGPVQGQRERRGVRVRRDAPHRRQGVRQRDDEGRRGDPARHPRADARDGGHDHPARPPASPEEAAGPVFFLCSPWANYVHGQVLHVTGGQFGGMYG